MGVEINIICKVTLNFEKVYFDLTDPTSVNHVVKKYQPEYFINFAAQSYVGESWNSPVQTFVTNTLSVIYLLEAIREYNSKCRLRRVW